VKRLPAQRIQKWNSPIVILPSALLLNAFICSCTPMDAREFEKKKIIW